MSDAHLKFQNIVARWPGSVHDQTIFNNSRLKIQLDNRDFEDKILLGDSGYALQTYLMTPLLQPNTAAENLYNVSHIRTRNTVERQYGVWKRRFPILSLGMRVGLDKAKTIIVATAIIHNIAIDMKNPEFALENEFEDEPQELVNQNKPNIRAAARRQNFITDYFGQI